jgi:hypothetical protein
MSLYTKEVYLIDKKEKTYGYKILLDGTPVLDQPFKPALGSSSTMNEAQANAISEEVLARISNKRTEQDNFEMTMLSNRFRNADPTLTITDFQRLNTLTVMGNPSLTVEEVIELCEGSV